MEHVYKYNNFLNEDENSDQLFYDFIDSGFKYTDSEMYNKLLNDFDFKVHRSYNIDDISNSGFLMFTLTNKSCYEDIILYYFKSLGVIEIDYVYKFRNDANLKQIVDDFERIKSTKYDPLMSNHSRIYSSEMFDRMLTDFLYYYLEATFIYKNKNLLAEKKDVYGDYLKLKTYQDVINYINNIYDIIINGDHIEDILNFNFSCLPTKLKSEDILILQTIL